MKRLILMRHAKTEPWTEGVEDHGRALTQVGHHAAQVTAENLVRLDWQPDVALVSSARRTRETWAHLKACFTQCQLVIEDDLYLAGERHILELIGQHAEADTVMVLGHNPGLHDMGIGLMREAGFLEHRAAMRLSTKFPTGAAALFEAAEPGPFIAAHYRLTGFIRPKDLI